jgi:hypothetical protein
MRESSTEAKMVVEKFKQLLKAKKRKFPEKGKPLDAPNERGVYIIFGRNKSVLHVGATPRGQKGIANRLKDHLQTRSSFTLKFPELKGDGSRLRNGYSFSYLAVVDNRIRAFLESYAVGRLCPRHIGVMIEARKPKT